MGCVKIRNKASNVSLQGCTLRLGSHQYIVASGVLQKYLESYVTKSSLILDAGCGSSAWHLVRVCPARGIALDVDRENVKNAAERARSKGFHKHDLSFVVGDIENLPFRRNMFDIIINCDVLEHVGNPKKAIQELALSLKKMGRLLITTSNLMNPMMLIDDFLPGSISERALRICTCAHAQVTDAHSRGSTYYERHSHLNVWNLIRKLRKNGLAPEKLFMFGMPPFGYIHKYKRHPIETHRMLCCSWIVFDKLTNMRFLRMFKEAMFMVARKNHR